MNLEEFKKHIKGNNPSSISINDSDSGHFILETDYALGDIIFNPLDIIEFKVTNKISDDIKFYLHFQLNDDEHAKELFNDFCDCIIDQKNHRTINVLLCCSSALTTSFFAQKLNDASEFTDFTFEACSADMLYQKAKDYSVVLVAPQIGYMQENLQASLPDKKILKIPTTIFASYDVNGCLDFLKEELFKKEEVQEEEFTDPRKIDKKVLIIAVKPDGNTHKLAYRLYEQGKPILKNEVIRYNRYPSLKDYLDIADTVTATHKDIDIIGLSLSSVIRNGTTPQFVDNQGDATGINLVDLFENRYHTKTIVDNNVNSAAYGIYNSKARKYKNIVFHSQPAGWIIAGQGIVTNGELLKGSTNVAGEVFYLMTYHLKLYGIIGEDTNMYKDLNNTTEIWDHQLILNSLVFYIVSDIALLNPEVIFIRNLLITDMDEVRNELKKYIVEEDIPELVSVPNFIDFVFYGELILALEALDQ